MADEQRQRLLGLLRRHGWNSTSFQVIEPECRYWFDPDSDAAVAYLDTGFARVGGVASRTSRAEGTAAARAGKGRGG